MLLLMLRPESAFSLNNGTLSPYNFYWILIDSTSSSMFKRSMRETRKVIVDEMGGIEFPYLNKVGSTSTERYVGSLDPMEFKVLLPFTSLQLEMVFGSSPVEILLFDVNVKAI